MEDFFIAILLGVCLSCLESNDLPSFPRSNIHNRHVKYVTVKIQLKCNTTKNNHFILKKYFIHPFIHKLGFSCYLRYILTSEIESFLKGICS